MQKPKGVIFYGCWGILWGVFLAGLPLLASHFGIAVTKGKLIGYIFCGMGLIIIGILVMTDWKLGKLQHKDKPLIFSLFSLIFIFEGFKLAALHYLLIGKRYFLPEYLFILFSIIIPITAVVYFNIPSVKRYFRGWEGG